MKCFCGHSFRGENQATVIVAGNFTGVYLTCPECEKKYFTTVSNRNFYEHPAGEPIPADNSGSFPGRDLRGIGR